MIPYIKLALFLVSLVFFGLAVYFGWIKERNGTYEDFKFYDLSGKFSVCTIIALVISIFL